MKVRIRHHKRSKDIVRKRQFMEDYFWSEIDWMLFDCFICFRNESKNRSEMIDKPK